MTVSELLFKTAKHLVIAFLATIIVVYSLNWVNHFNNTLEPNIFEWERDFIYKSLLFIVGQLIIAGVSYFFYESYLDKIIAIVEESWFSKVVNERDWLNHKELLNRRKTVKICITITFCLFVLQFSIFVILLNVLGVNGFSTETFFGSAILFCIYFVGNSDKLVLKAAKRIESKTLFFKWKYYYDFLNGNKKISDNYNSKLNRELQDLLNIRTRMQDFETVEVDTKLSKVKYLLIKIQDHLELFKDKKIQFIISEIPDKVNRFYYGDNGFRSIMKEHYRPEFITLSEQVGYDFEELNPGIWSDFPHYYFDFHLEQLNENDAKKLNSFLSNRENISKNYSHLILNPKITREIDEYFK